MVVQPRLKPECELKLSQLQRPIVDSGRRLKARARDDRNADQGGRRVRKLSGCAPCGSRSDIPCISLIRHLEKE